MRARGGGQDWGRGMRGVAPRLHHGGTSSYSVTVRQKMDISREYQGIYFTAYHFLSPLHLITLHDNNPLNLLGHSDIISSKPYRQARHSSNRPETLLG